MIIGDSAVGKTSLLNRHLKKKFSVEAVATVGVENAQTMYTSRAGEKIRFKIWDTAG